MHFGLTAMEKPTFITQVKVSDKGVKRGAELWNLVWESIILLAIELFVSAQVGLHVMPHDDDSRMAILAWNTCAYTIQVTGKLSCNLHEKSLRSPSLSVLQEISHLSDGLY